MHVFLIAALTADGYIAREAAQVSTKWTSKEDAQFFGERTKQAGVCIMGSTTFDTINRPLPGRTSIVYSKNSQKYEQWGDQVRATTLPPAQLLAQLQADGKQEVAICGGTSIYTQFMQAGLVERLYLTIEPVIFGSGLRLFADTLNTELKLVKTHQLSPQTIVQEYVVTRHHQNQAV